MTIVRLQRVRLAQGAVDHELVWSALFFCAMGAAALAPSRIMGKFHCVFFALTGLPCPTCGITRTTQALTRGDLGAAFSLSPFFSIVLLLGFCLALAGLAHSLLNLRRVRPIFASRQGPRLFALALLSPFIMHWIVRLLVAAYE